MDQSPAASKHQRALFIRSLKSLLDTIKLEDSRNVESVWYEFWNEVLTERTRLYWSDSLILTVAPQYGMAREALTEEDADPDDADWSTLVAANQSHDESSRKSDRSSDTSDDEESLPADSPDSDSDFKSLFARDLEGSSHGINRTSSPVAPNRAIRTARLAGTSELAIKDFVDDACAIGMRHSKGELRKKIQTLKARFAEAKKVVVKERRYPDFAAFVTMLRGLNVHWPFLIVEIKHLKHGGDPYSRIADAYGQALTQAKFTFEAFPTLKSIFALLISGPYWQLLEIHRDDLVPLPKTQLAKDYDAVNNKLVVRWESDVRFILDGLDGDDYHPDFLVGWDRMMRTHDFIPSKTQQIWTRPGHPVTAFLMLLVGLVLGFSFVIFYQAHVCQPDCSTVVDNLLRCTRLTNNGPVL